MITKAKVQKLRAKKWLDDINGGSPTINTLDKIAEPIAYAVTTQVTLWQDEEALLVSGRSSTEWCLLTTARLIWLQDETIHRLPWSDIAGAQQPPEQAAKIAGGSDSEARRGGNTTPLCWTGCVSVHSVPSEYSTAHRSRPMGASAAAVAQNLYRAIDVWIRVSEGTLARYRCFEILPAGKYCVQSKDFYSLALSPDVPKQLDNQFLELLRDQAPDERGGAYETLEEAIQMHERDFG
jgi:hypothetical protein